MVSRDFHIFTSLTKFLFSDHNRDHHENKWRQEAPFDRTKIESHLLAVYKHNLKHDLSDHANPQRPAYAFGDEGGLLLCSWPKGGKLSLPFVYSDEVWTGIEYQVAAHLMLLGKVDEGLDIVRTCRDRYSE